MPPGEGVADGEIDSYDSRVAEMCLHSQFVTRVATLGQKKGNLVGVRWHVCWR